METRPIIKLNLSPVDKTLELTSKVFLAGMWGFLVFIYFKLPNTIPSHFNALGEADSYGAKSSILFLPMLATIVYFGLTQLNKYPHIFNYITKITEYNAQSQYLLATRMLRFLKLVILIVFFLIALFTYLTAIGKTKGLAVWFLPAAIAIIIIPIIVAILQSFKRK